MIPRRVLFADPERSLPQLSPDGKLLAFLAPWQENLNVWLAPLDKLESAKPISQSEQPIKNYRWSTNSDYLIYFNDHKGDENWQLTTYDILNNKTHTVTEIGYQAKIIHLSAKHPEKILIGLNLRDKHYHDVYVLHLKENTLHCLYENHQYWDFIADSDFNLRFGIKVNKQDAEYIDFNSLKCVAKINQHDMFHLYFYSKLKAKISGDRLFYIQSLQTNTTQITELDLITGNVMFIAGDEKADISDILYSPQTGRLIAFSSYEAHKKWVGLNKEIQNDLAFLGTIEGGELDILSQTPDNQQWIISFIHDNQAVNYYHFDRRLQKINKLFESHREFQNYTLTQMQPTTIVARDGLACVSYLSLPANHQGGPLPLVLKVHGGPNFRDYWGYNAVHQWLANRGYAVLSMNYRASTGFGKQHSLAGNGEWGHKIGQDLLDAVSWALKEKITTPDKVAIFGQSFGGYQVLLALALSPEVFCCGVDIVGFTNVEKTLRQFPPYWQPLLELIYDAVGASLEDSSQKQFLENISPIHHAFKIKKPLLIAHGANDAQVKKSESEILVEALQKNQTPVTFAVFPDEGHTISRPKNRMAFYALVEAFLAKNLGGNFEPPEPELHSAMQIKINDFKLNFCI